VSGTNGQELPVDPAVRRTGPGPSPSTAGLAAPDDRDGARPAVRPGPPMALPRMLTPGATYLVTRRCLERRFRLRPEQAVNDLFDYLIGYAALQSGVEVVAFVALSSHWHAVIHDPDARLAEFVERLCSLAARSLNVLHGQVGQVWEAGSYSAVKLETRGEIVEKIAYCLANPVKAGLVETPEEWPGLITHVETLGRGMRPAKRPGFFFREDGEERRQGERDRRPRGWSKTPLPGAVVWELALPPGFESADELQRQVRVALDEKLSRIQADRRKAGKRACSARPPSWPSRSSPRRPRPRSSSG
jgi:putative transposase